MTFNLKARHVLLVATLLTVPAAGLAQNQVENQANQVAQEAQDLQEASNNLSAAVDAEQQANDDGFATAEGDRAGREDRRDDGDDDSGKWGLLGLLGLAGLLGLRRRDHDHHHHHVDRDYDRGTTRTGTTAGTRGQGGTDNRL